MMVGLLILLVVISAIYFSYGSLWNLESLYDEGSDRFDEGSDREAKFKKFIKIYYYLLSGLLGAAIAYQHCIMIKPGEVGVIINLLGSEKGISQKELTTGMHFVAPWKRAYLFPIYEQNHQWVGEEGFKFQTSEGLGVHADIGISYNLTPTRIHELFYKYRRGMEEITHLFVRNNIRDAINRVASTMGIEELYGPRKDEFFRLVQAQTQEELAPLGFNVNHIYIIGHFEVPASVITALNKKIEASQIAQQRENELRETEAQAKKEIARSEGEAKSLLIQSEAEAKKILINARAQADANTLLSKSLTRELINYRAISQWDGKLPSVLGNEKLLYMLSEPPKKS